MQINLVTSALSTATLALLMTLPCHAQMQSQGDSAPTPAEARPSLGSSKGTLEIPVIVQSGQPTPDLSLVGKWCGNEHFVSYSSQPSVPEPPNSRKDSFDCHEFIRNASGEVVFVGASVANPATGVNGRIVSTTAKAVNAREITVTQVADMSNLGQRVPGP
jgi:hypothetical protein